MQKVIAFPNESVVGLMTGPDVDALMASAPGGAILVDVAALPPGAAETWKIEDGVVVIDDAKKARSMQALNTAAIQSELDRQAQDRGYDNIVSACSYAAQDPGAPFQAEGAAFLQWRSAVWTSAYAVLAQVQAGTAEMPTPEEAVAMMPALVLP